MADDTRQPDHQTRGEPETASEDVKPGEYRRPRRPKPKHDFPKTQAGKMWEAFGNPDEPINTMPGGMVNTAGGRPREVTWRDAFKFSAFAGDGPKFYQTGCGRDALLVGIGSGGTVGGLRFIFTGLRSLQMSSNLAVGAFALASCGMYYWCDRRRQQEARGIAMAVAGSKMLNEKKARERAIEEAARATKMASDEEAKKKRSYKFW